MIAYYAAERARRAKQVESWAALARVDDERRAVFERQAAVPRAPSVPVGVHVFARRVMVAVRRLEGSK
jgi:hypothetical protein